MKLSTFGFLTRRGVRNLGKHWAMTIACIASLSVCMTLNTFATLAEVNVDSMVNYLGQQNEMVVFVDPEADDATTASVGERITATPGVSSVQYMSKEDTLNAYRGFLSDYASLLDEFENDNPFKANYRVSLSDLSQMSAISQQFQTIPGVYSVSAPVEMTNTFVEIQKVVTKGGQHHHGGQHHPPQRLCAAAGDRDHEVRRCHQRHGHPALLHGGPDHGPDLRCHHLGSGHRRLLLYRGSIQHLRRPVGDAHGRSPCAGGERLAHHPDLQSGGRRTGRCAGQHLLHPQASERVREGNRA